MMNTPRPARPIVLVGQVAPIGPDGPASGIDKHPHSGPWTITATGIVGDAQADLTRHGGPEKAIHHYPRDHYAAWQADIGALSRLDAAGAFGENISTEGWTEAGVCIGDIIGFGPVRLQVAQGRQPCAKLNHRFSRPDMAARVQKSGRTGWYYRVLEPGTAQPDDTLCLLERRQPDWPLSRLIDLLYRDTRNFTALAAMAALPELAESWRMLARRRVENRAVEDWSARLNGPRAVS